MNELIPALLIHDEHTFLERLRLLEHDFPLLQIDVMDGAFVPDRTWFDAAALGDLKTPTHFELHLMVNDPSAYLEKTKEITRITRLIWHIETQTDHGALIARCHLLGKEAGLAISPKTPLERLTPYTGSLDEILILGAEPGFSGQKLQPHTIARAAEVHQRWPDVRLGFDIHVNSETIPLLKDVGISRFCAASAIFGTADPLNSAKELRNLLA